MSAAYGPEATFHTDQGDVMVRICYQCGLLVVTDSTMDGTNHFNGRAQHERVHEIVMQEEHR